MGKVKITDQEFKERIAPLLSSNATPKLREIADATGLSISGVTHKLSKINARRTNKLVIPK